MPRSEDSVRLAELGLELIQSEPGPTAAHLFGAGSYLAPGFAAAAIGWWLLTAVEDEPDAGLEDAAYRDQPAPAIVADLISAMPSARARHARAVVTWVPLMRARPSFSARERPRSLATTTSSTI